MTQHSPPRPVFRDRRIMLVRPARPLITKRRGTGWLLVASAILVGSACVNIVWGILAIANDAYWGGDALQYGGITAFGWLFVCLGIFDLLVAGLVYAGSVFGALLASLMAISSAVLHVATTRGHPAPSVIMLAGDVLLLVALIVYHARAGRPG